MPWKLLIRRHARLVHDVRWAIYSGNAAPWLAVGARCGEDSGIPAKTKRNLRALKISRIFQNRYTTAWNREIVIEGQNRYVPRKSVQVGRSGDVNPPCSWGAQTLGTTSRRTRPALSRTWSRRWASWLRGNVYAGQASCPNPRTPGRCSVLPWLRGQRSHHLVGTHWIAERKRREGEISLCSL